MKTRSPITTHVLDVSKGKPADRITVSLETQTSGSWMELSKKKTNGDGRVEDFLPVDHKLSAGTYRLQFETEKYFQSKHGEGFYPSVTITFSIKQSDQHYHVPLLLSPFGYSTYRGS